MKKPGVKPKKRIDTTWNSDFAYALGLLATDGSLSKDGLHFDLTSKDLDQIKAFQNCLGLYDIKIGKKYSGKRSEKNKKYYYRIQFGDVNFYQWCLGFGFTPNKSKTMGALKVPQKYFFDFLRGCFDGDGSSYSYWDPRWRSSFMFYMSFTSASPNFLKWLQKHININADISGKITRGTRSYQLRFAKKESRVLVKKIYYTNNIPYLERKFAKIRKTLKIDDEHK